MVQTIKDTWRKGNNIGALSMDMKGAFPSIILEKLIHNMRCKGIPEEYTKWIKSISKKALVLYLNIYTTML